MPVYIGDVLESAGGPVLDLSTRQVKGIGAFTSNDERDELPLSMRSDGYLSVVGESYPNLSFHTGGDWDSLESWNPMLKFVGVGLKVTWSGQNFVSAEGFLVGSGTADFLRKGDVFIISGLNGAGDGIYSSRNDGAYLVVDDPWNQEGADATTGPSKASADYGAGIGGVLLTALQDFIDSGSIIRFSETKLLLDSLPNAAGIVDGELNAALLSSTNLTDIAVSVTDDQGIIRDAKISVNQFISMLGAGIADEYVASGYGDVTVYGGSPGVTSSGGDINGDGLVTVADILILLGTFGQEVDPTVELQDTVVSVPMSWGTTAQSSSTATSGAITNFWSGGSNRYYAFANWGTGPPNLIGVTGLNPPTVTAGAATVSIFSASAPATNSDSHYDDDSVSLGDPFVFSSTPSNDFTINAFPGSPSRLVLREPPTSENAYSGTTPVLPVGKRNLIAFTAQQAIDFNNGSNFQTFVRVKKYSSPPTSVGDLVSSVINTKIVTVGDIPFSSFGVPNGGGKAFFNFISPNTADTNSNQTQEADISALYSAQHGSGIFETENDVACVAIGVELGVRITDVDSSTSRNSGQGGSIDFSTNPPSSTNAHSAILQNIEVVLVPHNN